MQKSEVGDDAACAAAPSSHPLLDELRGKLVTLKSRYNEKKSTDPLSLTLDLFFCRPVASLERHCAADQGRSRTSSTSLRDSGGYL